jgi:hypothetical protein
VAWSATDSNLATGHGRFHLDDQHVPDFHDFFNAISPHPQTKPGLVSFDVHYGAKGSATHLRDATFGFEGSCAPAGLHIDFEARDLPSGVIYRSVAEGQRVVGGGMGHEQNGVFFS